MSRAVTLVVGTMLILVAVGCGGSGQQTADQGSGAPPPAMPPGDPGGMPAGNAGGMPPADVGSMPAGDAAAMPGDGSGMPPNYAGPMPGDMSMPGYDAFADGGMMPGYSPDGYMPGAGGMPVPKFPETYDARAAWAFGQGRESDAFKYLYAFALTNDEGAADLLAKIQWVSGLKAPYLAVRWGVGVQVTPDYFRGDLKPVGITQQLPVSRSSSRGRDGGQPKGGAGYAGEVPGASGQFADVPGGAQTTEMTRLVGELGDRLVTEFQTKVGNGTFGEVLRDAPLGGGPNRGGQEYGGAMEGDFGASGMPGAPMGPGAGGYAGPAGTAAAAARRGSQQISPGLNFLGTGKQDDLLKKAAREGMQVLAFFDVNVEFNRKTELVVNATALRLFDVVKQEEIYPGKERSKKLEFNNVKIQTARTANKEDGVEEAFGKLFEFMDQNLSMGSIPEVIKPEHVQNRVSLLASGKPDDLLATLTEISFWRRKNLLTEQELMQAYQQLIGQEAAEALMKGDEEAKTKIVEKYLPKL